MFQRQGAIAVKKDLHNIRKLCEALGQPQETFPKIHVAGTNGKGSVCAFLHSILTSAGYKTGSYTSPHLLSFTERIRIGQQNIPEEAVVEFVERCMPVIKALSPSFFEVTVAMAFWHFSREQVDLGIIEVGLGGRLDSTNIITPILSIITQIGRDHQQMLGETLPEIAREKAGIIKPGIPVIIGERQEETLFVFQETASAQAAPLKMAEDFGHVSWVREKNKAFVRLFEAGKEGPVTYEIGLTGKYQEKNLLSVFSAIQHLRSQGWEIPDSAVAKGLAEVTELAGLRGRMERLARRPQVWADVAHNPEGVAQLMDHIRQMTYDKLHLVWGMVQDKDHDLVFGCMPKEAAYYFVAADLPRALAPDQLSEKAGRHGLTGAVAGRVANGVAIALKHASPDDLVLIGGSVFTVAEALPLFEKDPTGESGLIKGGY